MCLELAVAREKERPQGHVLLHVWLERRKGVVVLQRFHTTAALLLIASIQLGLEPLERAVAVEVVGRSQMPGFEAVRAELEALPIAKVYEISEGDVPTPVEIGLKGADSAIWFGVFVPAKTPREIVQWHQPEIGNGRVQKINIP